VDQDRIASRRGWCGWCGTAVCPSCTYPDEMRVITPGIWETARIPWPSQGATGQHQYIEILPYPFPGDYERFDLTTYSLRSPPRAAALGEELWVRSVTSAACTRFELSYRRLAAISIFRGQLPECVQLEPDHKLVVRGESTRIESRPPPAICYHDRCKGLTPRQSSDLPAPVDRTFPHYM